MIFFRVRTCCVVGLTGLLVAAASAADSLSLFEIRDTAQVRAFWRAADAAGNPPPGNYQVLVRRPAKDTAHPQLVLLRAGTEIQELPGFALALLGGTVRREEPMGTPRPSETNVWRGLWDRRDSAFDWLQWPTGVSLDFQSAVTLVKGAGPEFDRRVDFVWRDRPIRWTSFEVGVHRSQYGGGLSQQLLDPADTGNAGAWGPGYWWWHAAVGVPGVKWEVDLADRPFPEFYWMDIDASHAALTRTSGVLVRQWEKGVTLPGNLSQALHLKFAALRYSIHFDGDAYRTPVQEIGLADLASPFGPFGFGFLIGGAIYTQVQADFFPADFGIPVPKSFPSAVRFTVLHLELAFRNKEDVHLNAAVRIDWDNPLLRRPGVKP